MKSPTTFGRKTRPVAAPIAPARPRYADLLAAAHATPDPAPQPTIEPTGNEPSEAEMERAFGRHWPKFRATWRATQGRMIWPGFSLAGLINNTFWLAYRRLYIVFAIGLAVELAIDHLLPDYSLHGAIGLALAVAIFGKSLAVNSVAAKVRALKALALPRDALHERLRSAGRTDLITPLVALVAMLILAWQRYSDAFAQLGGLFPPT